MPQHVYTSCVIATDYSGSSRGIQIAENIQHYYCLKLMLLFLSDIWLETGNYLVWGRERRFLCEVPGGSDRLGGEKESTRQIMLKLASIC